MPWHSHNFRGLLLCLFRSFPLSRPTVCLSQRDHSQKTWHSLSDCQDQRRKVGRVAGGQMAAGSVSPDRGVQVYVKCGSTRKMVKCHTDSLFLYPCYLGSFNTSSLFCLSTTSPHWLDLPAGGVFVIVQSLKTVSSLFTERLWTTFKRNESNTAACISCVPASSWPSLSFLFPNS